VVADAVAELLSVVRAAARLDDAAATPDGVEGALAGDEPVDATPVEPRAASRADASTRPTAATAPGEDSGATAGAWAAAASDDGRRAAAVRSDRAVVDGDGSGAAVRRVGASARG
jgi:hypothetical protein